MQITPWRLATVTGIAGLTAALVLTLIAAMRPNPLGPGEGVAWLLSYWLLLGFPLSLAVGLLGPLLGPLGAPPVLVQVLMILAVALDWALIGGLVGIAYRLFARPRTP